MRYADAGVSIALAEQAKQRIRRLAGRTFTRNVLGGIGGVGAPFSFCRERGGGHGRGSGGANGGTKLRIALSLGVPFPGGGAILYHSLQHNSTLGARPRLFL